MTILGKLQVLLGAAIVAALAGASPVHAGIEAVIGKTIIADFAIDRTVNSKYSNQGSNSNRVKCVEHFSAYFSTRNRLFISYQGTEGGYLCLDSFNTYENAGLVVDLGSSGGVSDGGNKMGKAVKLKYSVSLSDSAVTVTWSKQNPVFTDTSTGSKIVTTDSSTYTAVISFSGCKIVRSSNIRTHDDIDNPRMGKFGLDVVMKNKFSQRSCRIANGQPN